MKWGDAVATIAQPVARGFDRLLGTDIANCTTCKGRQDFLNQLGDSFYDYLWANGKEKQMEEIDYIIVQQVVVKAKSPKEAITKMDEGRIIGLNVAERPVPLGQERITRIQQAGVPQQPAAVTK